jgi:hypothetical protein
MAMRTARTFHESRSKMHARTIRRLVAVVALVLTVTGCGASYTEPKPGEGHHEKEVISRFCAHSWAEVKALGPKAEETYEAACE